MWDQCSLYRFNIHLSTSSQTLIILNLEINGIGNQGTQYLANALQNNTVKKNFIDQLNIYSYLSS